MNILFGKLVFYLYKDLGSLKFVSNLREFKIYGLIL